MTRVALATVILSVATLIVQAQPPRERPAASAPPTRSVSGRVLADETGDPIANARVTVVSAGLGTPVVLTSGDGRFTLTAPLARTTIAANKSGYGRRETIVTAAESTIEIRLLRGAAISGRVVNEFGDPVMGSRVILDKASAPSARFSGDAVTETDDRGEYRLGSLQPGVFTVAVVTTGPMVQRVTGPSQIITSGEPVKMYFPGVTEASDAEAFRLQPGEERSAVDFVVSGAQSGGPFTIATATAQEGADAPAVPRRTGIIRGRVMSTDGRPLPRAEVVISSRATIINPPNLTGTVTPFVTTATTDDDGRFEALELPAGSFRVAASKTGYTMRMDALGFGGPASGTGTTVDLTEGQTRERVDVTLARWGAISGHIFDELGEPMQGVTVQPLQVRYQAGRRRLVQVGGTSYPTDDRGRFRIFRLSPGQYIISATVGDVASADLPGYGRSYFPGTPNASEAQFVDVELSQDVTAIDLSMSRLKTARVAGLLLDSAGEPSTGGSVKLIPSHRSSSVTSVSVGARLLPDGRFEFPNVTPGQYVIQVDRGRRNSSTEGEFGALPVSVDGADVTGLLLQTSAGSSITGRVTFDAALGTKMPQTGQIELTPVPVDLDQSPGAWANADIHADWSFEIAGVNGPRRLELRRVPPGWMLKEIRVRDIDVTDRALAFGTRDQSLADVEVVLTDRLSSVSGTIVDDRAHPVPWSYLVLFSTDRDRWYSGSRFLRRATAGADGAIALAGLPAGSYYAAAVSQLPADGIDAWQEPAYLESLVPGASTVSLSDGEKRVLNLKMPAAAAR